MKSVTVMVVEDSEVIRKALSHLLKKLGFEVMEFEHGGAAWEFLANGGGSVDLVLSDIMMPELDGIELLKKCRAADGLKNLPFFLITAVSDKDYMAAAKAAGVTGYFIKPITFQRLKAKMQEIFPLKKMAV